MDHLTVDLEIDSRVYWLDIFYVWCAAASVVANERLAEVASVGLFTARSGFVLIEERRLLTNQQPLPKRFKERIKHAVTHSGTK
jgi:hypothetical protein